jgi:hypothetical protein
MWSHASAAQQCVPKMTLVPIVVHHCAPEMGPLFPLLSKDDLGHGGCLPPRKNVTDRQTDMDGPIRCSSLMLEHEEHIRRKLFEI